MNKIATLLKNGWAIDEIRFDPYQGFKGFYYTHAVHETGEAKADGAAETLTGAIDELYTSAMTSTPQWYKAQMLAEKAEKS